MKPLIYGYMRVGAEDHDDDLRRIEYAMRSRAYSEGFTYVDTFYERRPQQKAAFSELVNELQRSGASHVVVPSPSHLAEHRVLQEAMRDRLTATANALVLEAGGES